MNHYQEITDFIGHGLSGITFPNLVKDQLDKAAIYRFLITLVLGNRTLKFPFFFLNGVFFISSRMTLIKQSMVTFLAFNIPLKIYLNNIWRY